MKTIEDTRTDYVNTVTSLVTSGKISVDEADDIFRSVREYMDSFANLIISNEV